MHKQTQNECEMIVGMPCYISSHIMVYCPWGARVHTYIFNLYKRVDFIKVKTKWWRKKKKYENSLLKRKPITVGMYKFPKSFNAFSFGMWIYKKKKKQQCVKKSKIKARKRKKEEKPSAKAIQS